MLRNNLMLPTEALDIPEATDFDGTNDYLSRSSDLVGNADGKTFTFSVWVYKSGGNLEVFYTASNLANTAYGFEIYGGANDIAFVAKNSAGTTVLYASGNINFALNTFFHVLVSVDLSNTSKRFVYINDLPITTTWSTYVNDNIKHTQPYHVIGAIPSGGYKDLSRLSNVYLDYTYRDLSVEANRRLFITADRKPAANQQALNPILYLPLNDPTQPGKNLGTGGDFNLTGVVARSGRGPNQYNAAYSDLNGTSQYLSRTSITGIADSKTFTFHCVVNPDAFFGVKDLPIFQIQTSTNRRFRVYVVKAGLIAMDASSSSGTQILTAATANNSVVAPNRNYILTVSVDLSDTNKRHIYLNGASSAQWPDYVDDIIDFAVTTTPTYRIGYGTSPASYLYDGRLGNVFFDTKYIDLSNPDNLAKFVTGTGIDAKPVDLGANGELPFGTAPLIYLPMYGNNAGKNYGTGGDFTVDSGPYTGARGPNEFWGNKADFDGSTGYLARTSALAGVSDGKTFSCCFTFTPDNIGTDMGIFIIATSGEAYRVYLLRDSANGLTLICKNSANSAIVNTATAAGVLTSGGVFTVLLSIDGANVASSLYINGTSYSLGSISLATNIEFSQSNQHIGGGGVWSKVNGKLSEFYFTTEYIDFSLEANRLKFRDAFGNPVALQPQIEAGTLPNPAIYMRFDPANLGKNSGTGGDFTVNGTITDGGQL